jgi:F0F1-type ATP synthase membrane subunit b/b'
MLSAEVLQQIALSAVLFILVWQLVGNQVLKPFFELLEQREARTVGDDKQVIAKKAEVKQLEKTIEEELKKTRVEAAMRRDEKVQHAKKKAQAIITEATSRAEEELKKSEQFITELQAQARKDIVEQSVQLANEVVSKTKFGQGVGLIH